jgi:hypothetical protein
MQRMGRAADNAIPEFGEKGICRQSLLPGFDHLLYVLALLLIVRDGWTLVRTIAALPVAHNITP